jgi:uncharacterized protein (TIGR03790 family)
MNKKTQIIAAVAAFLFCLPAVFADYSDVLLVINNNSTNSIAIGNYFIANRPNLTHVMNITTANNSDAIKFPLANSTIFQPIRAYLNGSNGTGINYVLLSKDIPLWTNESEQSIGSCGSVACQNASSIDTEIMILNTASERYLGMPPSTVVLNPYFAQLSGNSIGTRFSHSRYNVYLVTRLEAYNASTIYSMIDKSTNIKRANLLAGLHVLTTFDGSLQQSQINAANQTLKAAGLNVFYNSSLNASNPATYKANQSNVSYFDTFGCYNFGSCLTSGYLGRPNHTWVNGSIVDIKYSWSARSVRENRPNESMVADFLEEGATSGIGYAVEPNGDGIAYANSLASNYVYGLRLGELAWSSIYKLSWAAVVFGDPKAGFPSVDIAVSPSYPLVTDNLTCNSTIFADMYPTLNVTYEWYKNGVNQTSLGGSTNYVPTGTPTLISNVTSGNLSGGDIWFCKVSLFDSTGFLFARNSTNVTVTNPASVNACATLGTANLVYNMSTNISASGSCFTVAAQNVTLDCNGYSLTDTSGGGTAIGSTSANTTVKNCRIGGFYVGTELSGNNGRVQNVTTYNISGTGVVLSGSSCRLLDSNISGAQTGINFASNGGTIANSTISSTSSSEGTVQMFGTSNSYILYTNVSSVDDAAISIQEDGASNTLIGVSTHSANSYGLKLYSTYTNTIANSTFSSDATNGLYMIFTQDNTITTSNISSASDDAAHIESNSGGDSITSSFITSPSASGISLASASGATLTNNTIISSTASISIDAGSSSTTALQNNLTGTPWVSNSGTGSIFNNSNSGNTYYLANGTPSWLIFDIRDTDGNGYADDGPARPFNATIVGGNWSGSGGDFFPYVYARVFGNGSNISAYGVSNLTITIDGNVSINGRPYSGTHAVNISSNNTTLVSFTFNFTISPINFSSVSISNGTNGGASYFTISGIPSGALVGGKNITLYGASSLFSRICVKNEENTTLGQISPTCSGSNEISVPCDGTLASGITCTRNGANLTISNLTYTGLLQFNLPSGLPGSSPSSNGGSSIFPNISTTAINQTNTTANQTAGNRTDRPIAPNPPSLPKTSSPASPTIPPAPPAPGEPTPQITEKAPEIAISGIILIAILAVVVGVAAYVYLIRKKQVQNPPAAPPI